METQQLKQFAVNNVTVTVQKFPVASKVNSTSFPGLSRTWVFFKLLA